MSLRGCRRGCVTVFEWQAFSRRLIIPETYRRRFEKQLKRFDGEFGDEAHVSLPFLDRHPDRGQVFRTNARRTGTFDQIGLLFREVHYYAC